MEFTYLDWKKSMMTKEVKALNVLSFPAIQLMDISVKELINDSHLQAKAMLEVAKRCPKQEALVSMMDLSVEAEAFGSHIEVSEDEVPTVVGSIVKEEKDAQALVVPEVGSGRTQLYIEAIREVAQQQNEKPILAGVIGPFSLAGRLMDVSEVMINCVLDPDFVKVVLNKVTSFIIGYIKAFKEAGANGIMMAEPLAGLMSPELILEFSSKYVKQIVDEVQDEHFMVVYHNCGPNTVLAIDEILACNAAAYHFGNAVEMKDILEKVGKDCIVMGNVDPAKYFRNGTKEEMKEETNRILNLCGEHENFIISSGCDIPPLSKWENIDAFYECVNEYNKEKTVCR